MKLINRWFIFVSYAKHMVNLSTLIYVYNVIIRRAHWRDRHSERIDWQAESCQKKIHKRLPDIALSHQFFIHYDIHYESN